VLIRVRTYVVATPLPNAGPANGSSPPSRNDKSYNDRGRAQTERRFDLVNLDPVPLEKSSLHVKPRTGIR
jgi:hypothetical protein